MAKERKNAEWKGTLQCLAHVALLFAPIALGLGLLATVAADKERRAALPDQTITGSIQKR